MIFNAHQLWIEMVGHLNEGSHLPLLPPPQAAVIAFSHPFPGAPYPRDLKKMMKRIARDEVSHDYTYQDLQGRVDFILRPVRVYLASQTLAHAFTLKVFKAASLWNPLTAKFIIITPDLLQERLNGIPWMDAELRTALEAEVAPYKAACALVEGPVEV